MSPKTMKDVRTANGAPPRAGRGMKNVRAPLVFALALPLLLTSCGPLDVATRDTEDDRAKAIAGQIEQADQENQEALWQVCIMQALANYDREHNAWGQPVPGNPGVRSDGPAKQLQDMENRLKMESEQCGHNFPKGVAH